MKKSLQTRMQKANYASKWKGSSDAAKKAHRYEKNHIKRKLDRIFERDYNEDYSRVAQLVVRRAVNSEDVGS